MANISGVTEWKLLARANAFLASGGQYRLETSMVSHYLNPRGVNANVLSDCFALSRLR